MAEIRKKTAHSQMFLSIKNGYRCAALKRCQGGASRTLTLQREKQT